MEDDLADWRTSLHPVYLKYRGDPEDDPDYDGSWRFYPHIRRGKDEKPKLTVEDEYLLLQKQVRASKGFDIDFTKIRCVFNYRPLNLDSNDLFDGPETTREFIERMSRGSLERFNERSSTKYEYVKAIKINYHFASGIMYYITFQAKLPSDDDPKEFQARVCYCSGIADFITCELKPQKNVHSIDAPEKEDPKKPRMAQEPSSNV